MVAKLGGNKEFVEFMLPYNQSDRERAIKLWYKTDAAHYYRKMMRSKALGREWTKQPPATTFGGHVQRGIDKYGNFMDTAVNGIISGLGSKKTTKENSNQPAAQQV